MKTRTTSTLAISAILLASTLDAQTPWSPPKPDRVILDLSRGELMTVGQEIHARLSTGQRVGSNGVEFFFMTSDGRRISLGVDRLGQERSFGPDSETLLLHTDEFSVKIGQALHGVPEGPGRVSFREIGTDAEIDSVQVYWDETPPRAKFRRPAFNQVADATGGFGVVCKSSDENLVSVNVFWQLANLKSRNVPTFEQHALSAATHNGCVPTTVAANLTWLEDTSQWTTRPPLAFFTDKFMVNTLGYFMDTTASSGTTGAGEINGTKQYLDFWMNYLDGVDYNLIHLGAADFGKSATQFGFSPEQVLEQFEAGGPISLGFHNLANEPPFGHFLVLDNVVLLPSGDANIRVMDPHVSPPAAQGVYRSFHLNKNGTVNWSAANPNYYSPVSGKVALDELHIIRDYHFFNFLVAPAAAATAVPTGGQVPGALGRDGQTWTGRFTPPAGSRGPWLLTTESTDASGHMEREYRYIGGVQPTVSQ